MKPIKFIPVVMAITLFSACGSEDENATPEVPASSTANPSVTTPAPATGVAPTAPANTNIALNPAHGQPGHRCDIAVGAPLNSPPGKSAPAPSAPAQVTPAPAGPATDLTPSKGVLNTGGSANGLNPAHGQPGHRCDIAVGAPLNSKPLNQ